MSVEAERKLARKEYMKNWRDKNTEKLKEYFKEYRMLNSEKIKKYMDRYRRENKQSIKKTSRAYYVNNYENYKNYRKKYWTKNSTKLMSYHKDYRNKFPERYKAHFLINNAVARGKINRQPCIVCGKENAHGHHTNYSKPFQVEWLCPHHHREAHARR